MVDVEVLEWMQSVSSPALDSVMVGITLTATHAALWFILAFLMTCSGRYRRVGVAIVVAVVVSYIVVDLVIKPIVGRERPFEVMGIEPIVSAPNSYSFPSGHTASSFAAATVIAVYARKAGALALAYAGLVGISRMYLLMHWPTDVVAGAAVGVAVALAVLLSMDRWIPYFRDLPHPGDVDKKEGDGTGPSD